MTVMDRMNSTILKRLGVVVQLKGQYGGFVGTLDGVFDYEYVELAGSETRAPVFTCATQDLPTDSHDYILDIPDQASDYKVITPQPDGTGITRLLLEKIVA